MLGPLAIKERVSGLLKVETGRADVRDHHRLTVTAQRVLQKAGQLTVSEVHVLSAVLVTCVWGKK